VEWARHPSFSKPVDGMTRLLFPKGSPPTSRMKSMVFLCGGADRTLRNELAGYLRSRHKDDLEVFYAEDVWSRVNNTDSERNALELEHRLAEVADLIIIVLESAGAIAELGAFAADPPLRKKLLPIMDKKYARDDSFINMGPIRWVDAESHYKPSIVTSYSPISLCASDLDDRLRHLPRYKFYNDLSASKPALKHALKHAVALVADLTALLAPVSSRFLYDYLANLKFALPSDWTMDAVIGLSVSMGMITEHEVPEIGKVYTRKFQANSMETRLPISTSALYRTRARILSGIQKIPLAWSCFRKVNGG
jgi:hypothetical protein